MNQIKNCLGFLFPSLLEGLTHPDQRSELPKRSSRKKYQRVNNPGNQFAEDDDDEDEDVEMNTTRSDLNKSPTGENRQEEPTQFFNEFTSWRSQQQNAKNNEVSMEMQQLQKNYALPNQKKPKPPLQKNEMIMLSENEIDKQRKQIVEDDDIFKEFNKQEPVQAKEEKKGDVLEDKGWDDELDIRIE